MQYKVAIVGPESTGKSSLAKSLARYFHTEFVPEIAREYLEKLDAPYSENDLLTIAKVQCETEDRLSKKVSDILICDTTLLVIKIWSEVKYNRCDTWIIEEEERRKYDLFLLCNIDLEWEPDPLREHPDKREFLFNFYLDSLKLMNANYSIISGIGESRFENAKSAIYQHHKLD